MHLLVVLDGHAHDGARHAAGDLSEIGLQLSVVGFFEAPVADKPTTHATGSQQGQHRQQQFAALGIASRSRRIGQGRLGCAGACHLGRAGIAVVTGGYGEFLGVALLRALGGSGHHQK